MRRDSIGTEDPGSTPVRILIRCASRCRSSTSDSCVTRCRAGSGVESFCRFDVTVFSSSRKAAIRAASVSEASGLMAPASIKKDRRASDGANPKGLGMSGRSFSTVTVPGADSMIEACAGTVASTSKDWAASHAWYAAVISATEGFSDGLMTPSSRRNVRNASLSSNPNGFGTTGWASAALTDANNTRASPSVRHMWSMLPVVVRGQGIDQRLLGRWVCASVDRRHADTSESS